MTPLEVKREGEQILSLADAAKVVPHSETALYRIARAGGEDNPFRKVAGRWCTTLSDLVAWVRAGDRGPGARSSSDPIPPVRKRREDNSIRSMVVELRKERRHVA